MLQPIWVHPKTDPNWVQTIIKEFNIHPVTAQVLAARGFTSIQKIHEFLYAKLPNLHDPRLFPDMDKAIQRIYKAFKNKENILVYGDNDVDGMTGTALLTEFFRYVGGQVFFYVSNRASLKESPIHDALDYAVKNQCRLLITVDCGISAADEMISAARENIDVIITDHHEPTDKLPHCIATLNPKLLNSTYPDRNLTGVGVAFKLAHAFTNLLIENGDIKKNKVDLKRYLDLVALGTIADMGSLIEENRILVRYGLKRLKENKRIGLSKLLSVCDLKPENITPIDIASKIAPRLNSLGRIADPIKGVELLLIKDPVIAATLANELDLNNSERQKIERKDAENIENRIAKSPEILQEKAIVLASEKWHPGIIPIITARMAKQYNRPTLIIAIDQGLGKGSMRTIPEFPLLPCLKGNASLLENFGGHDFAAGLSIQQKNIEEFKKRFISAANEKLQDHDMIAKLFIDAEVHFKDLTFDFMESLSLLEPFGNENPPPILHCSVKQVWPPKVVGKTHLKFYLKQDDRLLEGIGFGMAGKKNALSKKNLSLDIAFTPHINNFQNKFSIQLQMKDIQINKEVK